MIRERDTGARYWAHGEQEALRARLEDDDWSGDGWKDAVDAVIAALMRPAIRCALAHILSALGDHVDVFAWGPAAWHGLISTSAEARDALYDYYTHRIDAMPVAITVR